MADEILVPVQVDLTKEDNLLDIIRGLENVQREDAVLADTATFAEGDWAVLNDSNELEAPSATPVFNTYPVWAGNNEGRSDVAATGKATIILNDFIYRTTKFDDTQTYNVGDGLTIKDLGGGERVPTLVSGSQPVIARVKSIPANGIMDIQVIRN